MFNKLDIELKHSIKFYFYSYYYYFYWDKIYCAIWKHKMPQTQHAKSMY